MTLRYCVRAELKTDLDNLGLDSMTALKGSAEVCAVCLTVCGTVMCNHLSSILELSMH